MPADSNPQRSEGLWEKSLMKFRLQIFISNTWPRFLLLLFSKPTRDIIYWGRATQNWSLFLNLVTHLNSCFLCLLLSESSQLSSQRRGQATRKPWSQDNHQSASATLRSAPLTSSEMCLKMTSLHPSLLFYLHFIPLPQL